MTANPLRLSSGRPINCAADAKFRGSFFKGATKGQKTVTLYATNRLDRLSLWCKIYVTGEVPGK